MDDLASLGIKIDVGQVKEAIGLLNQLADAAGGAEQPVQRLGKASKAASMELGLLKSAAVGLFGAFSLKVLMDTADAFSDMKSRVDLAAGSIEKGGAVMDQLSVIARQTYSSLNQTAEGYLANASTMRELGYSTQQVLDYTGALNNAMVVSGAKAEHAARVQDALAKAMTLGKLSGDNLNAVMERGGRVVELLTGHFNTNREGLMALGSKGKITGDVIANVLIKNMQKLVEEAESMDATIADGFTLMGNAVVAVIGKWDQASGASLLFAEALIFVADNMEQIATIGLTAAGIYGGAFLVSMGVSALATKGLTGALIALRGALIKTGVGALVVGVGQLVYMLLEARSASESWGEAFEKVAGRFGPLTEGIKWTFYAMVDAMKAAFSGGMAYILQVAEKTFGALAKVIGVAFGGFGDVIKELKLDASDFAANAADQLGIAGEHFAKAFAEFGKTDADTVSLEDKLKRLNIAANDNDKSARRMKKAWDDLLRGAKDRVASMELEAQLVGKNAIEAEVLRIKLEALQEAEKKGLKLKPEQIAQLDALATKYGEVARKVAELQLMEDAAFDRQQLGRSSIDQRIMADLKSYGIEANSVAGQAYAEFVRTTDQISMAKDATRDFAGTLVSDLLQGKSAVEALANAFQNLGNKLIDMALDEMINGLFKNLLGVFGGGGGLFGGGGGIGAGSAQFAASGGIGLFAKGGVTNQPAIFGEAGPEAAVPLPDGRTIPVTLSGNTGGTAVVNDNRVYSFKGTGEEVEKFRQEVARLDSELDARAVGAVMAAEKDNYKFGT